MTDIYIPPYSHTPIPTNSRRPNSRCRLSVAACPGGRRQGKAARGASKRSKARHTRSEQEEQGEVYEIPRWRGRTTRGLDEIALLRRARCPCPAPPFKLSSPVSSRQGIPRPMRNLCAMRMHPMRHGMDAFPCANALLNIRSARSIQNVSVLARPRPRNNALVYGR